MFMSLEKLEFDAKEVTLEKEDSRWFRESKIHGFDFFQTWQISEDGKVRHIKDIKVSDQCLDQLSPNFLAEIRFVSIQTKSGEWVLLPGLYDYGFLFGQPEIIEKKLSSLNGKMIKQNGFYHKTGEHWLYIEDRFITDTDPKVVLKLFVDINYPWRPVYLVKVIDNILWSVASFYKGSLREESLAMVNTKINPLTKAVMTI
jgi:hypothetical protein